MYPKAITQFFNGGHYYDYNPNWFYEVGNKLTQAMIIQTIIPIFVLMFQIFRNYLTKLYDSRFTMDPFVTRQTEMTKYKEIYSGQKYEIYTKYVALLNIYFLTMMYGIGMPILFPLAAVGLLLSCPCP